MLIFAGGLLLEASVPTSYVDSYPDAAGILVITDANHGERNDDGTYVTNIASAYFSDHISSPAYFGQLFEDQYRHVSCQEPASGGSSLHMENAEVTFPDVDTEPLTDFTLTTAVRYNHTDDDVSTPPPSGGDDGSQQTTIIDLDTSAGDVTVTRNETHYTLTVTEPGDDTPSTEVSVPGSTTGDWESVGVVRQNGTITLIVVDDDGNSEQSTGDFPTSDDVIVETITTGDRDSSTSVDVDTTLITTVAEDADGVHDNTHNPPHAGDPDVAVEIVYEGSQDSDGTPVIETVHHHIFGLALLVFKPLIY